ncbi:MAG: amino acid permease [Saprospiraceae bacterium]|nr:MAG: amino acid permease [Saprospiraceae bacterium]
MKNKSQTAHLVKYFGLSTGILLLVSSIIGTGVYKKVAPMADSIGSPELVLLAWLLAGIVTLLGVLTVAEVAVLIPVSGGSFSYLEVMYGEKTGYFFGWTSFACIQSASVASIAYVFAQSLHSISALPSLGGEWETLTVLGIFTPFANLGVKMVAVALIVLLTAINYRGVKQGGRVSIIITVLVVVSLLFIVLTGLSMGGGSMENIAQTATTGSAAGTEGNQSFLKMIFLAMLAAFWAFEGWINVGFVGDEIQNPQRNIPRILIFGTLIITGIYLLVNFTYLYVLPIDNIIAVAKQDNGIAAVEVIRKFAGPGGVLAISLLIVITTFGCTNATILTAARVYYAMAKKGLFFKKAAEVHPKYHTPANALVMFAIWSCVLVFSGTFDQLTEMLVFVQFIFYGLVIAGVFVLRKKMPDAPRSYKVLGYPVVPILFLLFCAGLLVNTVMERPREAGIGLFLMAIGTPFYFLFKKKNVVDEG